MKPATRALLRYCELQGHRLPSTDDYEWARICQVVSNFFFGGGQLERRPYVAMYDHDGDFSWNPNNYPKGDIARIRPQG